MAQKHLAVSRENEVISEECVFLIFPCRWIITAKQECVSRMRRVSSPNICECWNPRPTCRTVVSPYKCVRQGDEPSPAPLVSLENLHESAGRKCRERRCRLAGRRRHLHGKVFHRERIRRFDGTSGGLSNSRTLMDCSSLVKGTSSLSGTVVRSGKWDLSCSHAHLRSQSRLQETLASAQQTARVFQSNSHSSTNEQSDGRKSRERFLGQQAFVRHVFPCGLLWHEIRWTRWARIYL